MVKSEIKPCSFSFVKTISFAKILMNAWCFQIVLTLEVNVSA